VAAIADIKPKPKFFELRKNYNKNNLCEVCKEHKIIVAMKWGCDYIITTDLLAQDKAHLKSHIHVWCVSDKNKPEGKSPPCFREYKDVGYCSE